MFVVFVVLVSFFWGSIFPEDQITNELETILITITNHQINLLNEHDDIHLKDFHYF